MKPTGFTGEDVEDTAGDFSVYYMSAVHIKHFCPPSVSCHPGEPRGVPRGRQLFMATTFSWPLLQLHFRCRGFSFVPSRLPLNAHHSKRSSTKSAKPSRFEKHLALHCRMNFITSTEIRLTVTLFTNTIQTNPPPTPVRTATMFHPPVALREKRRIGNA